MELLDTNYDPAEYVVTASGNKVSRNKGVAFFPLHIGDHVFIGEDSIINAAQIGSYVHIGKNCVVSRRCVLKDACALLDNTVLAAETVVPPAIVKLNWFLKGEMSSGDYRVYDHRIHLNYSNSQPLLGVWKGS
ncbi:unnamed protein product [Dibothriocephalus latus]|uniref:Dynactin subunit 5 n=1 Tax=Dibothriocephalus latus TaxID=60516 RepID=A0A3P7LJG8_DIBLA|nr:unnamed protein product [Dibothriocephalus latus]